MPRSGHDPDPIFRAFSSNRHTKNGGAKGIRTPDLLHDMQAGSSDGVRSGPVPADQRGCGIRDLRTFLTREVSLRQSVSKTTSWLLRSTGRLSQPRGSVSTPRPTATAPGSSPLVMIDRSSGGHDRAQAGREYREYQHRSRNVTDHLGPAEQVTTIRRRPLLGPAAYRPTGYCCLRIQRRVCRSCR